MGITIGVHMQYLKKKLIAICKINENVLKPIRVLNIEDKKTGE